MMNMESLAASKRRRYRDSSCFGFSAINKSSEFEEKTRIDIYADMGFFKNKIE